MVRKLKWKNANKFWGIENKNHCLFSIIFELHSLNICEYKKIVNCKGKFHLNISKGKLIPSNRFNFTIKQHLILHINLYLQIFRNECKYLYLLKQTLFCYPEQSIYMYFPTRIAKKSSTNYSMTDFELAYRFGKIYT